MAQVLNDPYSGNIFGRLGQGLGQGISEQLPKEVENYRKSKAISALSNENGLNLAQNAANLTRAGVPSHEINQYLDLMQRQRGLNAALNPGDTGGEPRMGSSSQGRNRTIPSTQERTVNQAVSNQNQQNTESNIQKQANVSDNVQGNIPSQEGIIPSDQNLRGSGFLEPATPQQKEFAVADLLRSGRFTDPDQAAAYVDKQEASRLAGDTAFQEKQQYVEDNLPIKLQNVLQKDANGVLQDIPANIQKKMINKARGEVARGSNPDQVMDKYAEIGRRLSQTAQKLRDKGARSWLDTSYSDNRKSFQTMRKVYEEAGALEEFSDEMQATQNMTKHYTDNVAFPLDKDINNILVKAKPRRGGKGIGSREEEAKVAQEIGEKWKPGQSLFTVGLQASLKGLDDKFIVNYLRDNFSDRMDGKQIQDLSDYRSPSPKAGDIWTYTMSGLPELKEIK